MQMREAQIDGDAAALLFLQAVGVDAGERFDQRGLAVIDVAGGADNDVLHRPDSYRYSFAACYIEYVLAVLFLVLVVASLVYCVLTVIAALRYRAVVPPPLRGAPPVSVLKPLAGIDDGLEDNLRTFFEQQYDRFELLFAVRSPQDPAVPVVDRLRSQYPAVPSQIIDHREPPYPNAKVFSLDCMLAAARYDLIVMADSDVRVDSGHVVHIWPRSFRTSASA